MAADPREQTDVGPIPVGRERVGQRGLS
jgi:hypothetical protein